MDPRRQGQFVHEVFEEFFRTWQAQGSGAITPDESRDARDAVHDGRRRAARAAAGRRSGARADALLGRRPRPGLGEAVLRMEAERPVAVVERLLEHRLERRLHDRDRRRPRTVCAQRQGGSHRSAGGRHVPADRLQARMAAATRRARCSCRSTASAPSRAGRPRGRALALGEAAYLAFKGPKRVVPLFPNGANARTSWRRRSSGWPTRSTRSSAANFHRRPTMCTAARRAASRRSAGRITSAMSELRLPFDDEPEAVDDQPSAGDPQQTDDRRPAPVERLSGPLADAAARRFAVDPAENVVLEASAGTGKTRVLVERYVNLLRAGVDPDNILAITFTRKAAAEMRQRIIERLKEASRLSQVDAARWRDLRDRLGDIAHLDDRRVLPLAAARVSARSRRRSGLRSRGRHRRAASHQRVARPGAPHLPRASRKTTMTWRWSSRSSASAGCDRNRRAARSAARRAAGAGPLSGAKARAT